jgi:hypothetical protein
MIPKEELKFFIRFLKDKGLYYAFLKDLRRSEPFGKENFHQFIDRAESGGSTNIIMNCILWVESLFPNWHDIYSEYANYFYDEYGK